MLAFTGGACSGDYGTFLGPKSSKTFSAHFPFVLQLNELLFICVKASMSRAEILAFTGEITGI